MWEEGDVCRLVYVGRYMSLGVFIVQRLKQDNQYRIRHNIRKHIYMYRARYRELKMRSKYQAKDSHAQWGELTKIKKQHNTKG